MSLKNDGTKLFDYDYNTIIPSLEIFKRANRRLQDKKQALEDMQNEYNLLERQAFNNYVEHVNYNYFSEGVIKKSIDWLNMSSKKLDMRKNYAEKDIYDYLTQVIGIDNMVITDIYNYNYGEGYDIRFTSHEQTWELYIPIVNKVPFKSFQEQGETCFKLRLSHESRKSYFEFVGSTFDENELKEIFNTYIDKKGL